MNCSRTPNGTEPEGPCVYCWCMLFLAYVPIVTLSVTVFVAVLCTKSVPTTIRLVLANILAASLTTIAGTAMVFLNRAILSSVNNLCPSDAACRVYYWLISTGGTARLSFMATFAMVVFIIIRCSNAAVRPISLFLSVVAIWISVIAFSAQVSSSQIVVTNFLNNVTCVPHFTMLGLLYAVPFAIIFALVPITLAILLPSVTVCFIKNNKAKMEGRSLPSKAMVKFSLFLLLGNILALLGQGTPVLLATAITEGGNANNRQIDEAVNYVNGILITLSFIPTPILILVYFKPVWKELRKFLVWLYKCVCCKYIGTVLRTAVRAHERDDDNSLKHTFLI